MLRDCSNTYSPGWVYGDWTFSLGQFIQSVEYPGICFEIIQISETDPGSPVNPITPIGPVFTSCEICLENVINGCTDPTACNYDPCATIDDGSCFYNNITIRVLCNDPITLCNN